MAESLGAFEHSLAGPAQAAKTTAQAPGLHFQGAVAAPDTAKIVTILVAEDMAGLRNHVVSLLQKSMPFKLNIIQASDGQNAVEQAILIKPDLVIMDIAMPHLNGIKAAQQIWAANPRAKILFWSQFYREIYIRDLARIVPDEAVHGYVLKSGSDENFLYAVSCLLVHDNPYIDPAVRKVSSGISSKGNCLSDVELETLNDLALGMTDKAIALRRQISLRGVQSRIGSLYTKLLKREDETLKQRAGGTEIVNQRARLIFEAMRRGLIVPEDFTTLDDQLNSWIQQSFQP